MGLIIGIDIGVSTTKIVGLDEGSIISPLLLYTDNPAASVNEAFGSFLDKNSFGAGDIERAVVTGVGASFINEKIRGIHTGKVDEFRAIAAGGLFLSGLSKAIVVSMGTGTALVRAEGDSAAHIGGTGVGGGTLLGLSKGILNICGFDELMEAARSGSLSGIDLTIGDIASPDKPIGLPPETTASNFGKVCSRVKKSDAALGIINMIFEVIGMMAVLSTRNDNIKDVVLTGNLTKVPQAAAIFDKFKLLSDVRFFIPENAEYAAAVGAALGKQEDSGYAELY